jgi:uncharacterized repeat protein (TIGR03803 family)
MKTSRALITTALALTLLTFAALPAIAQYNVTVLHTFTGSADGGIPTPLIRDAKGNLYGAAEAGGSSQGDGFGCGYVFKVDSADNLTDLYDFTAGSNGVNPLAALVRDKAGDLFGTTVGSGFFGSSVVYKLTPKGQETSYVAPPTVNWGSLDSPVALDAKGNLYGMVPYGGTPNCGWDYQGLGCGTLFKMTPDGTFSTIHNFTGTDGMFPESGLVQDSKGNFYGVAVFGGIRTCRGIGNGRDNDGRGCGTIFKVDVSGNFSVLHTFKNQKDGSGPLGVIIDSEDNLYGIATGGGNHHGSPVGYGTIFKLDTKTGAFSVLYKFTPQTSSGAYYAALLARDAQGNLYGTPWFGGAHSSGCLFRIDTKGKYTDLFDFDEHIAGKNNDGFFPAGILVGLHGDFYGSMTTGGSFGLGTVFHITP